MRPDKARATVGAFLQKTSIHGVSYLVESRNPVARLVWLAAILTCLASAATIICMNVANWNNSPAVVTGVEPDRVKVIFISTKRQ